MAWQLIYTSAPRSLEAGRSGFGTVARHKALSPLLVSAIERTSQFSRLPGVDTDRVIFSHRVVTVAGSRFHVLSSIRDAGADYTGRTNHIAHHLIVDPREIAQLGAGGPSPADVLLAMPWAPSWTEHPRYLEAADEVALATLHARTTGTAWQRITGDPNQAWLLASGEASRGAYIIQPPGVDLREVFAESLRLMPERLWQISFTTSLQPSDESADFRWIGIEERSPLRAQAESSGRPVLNLASPGTLPLVEVAQPAPAVPVPPSAPSSEVVTPSPAPMPDADQPRKILKHFGPQIQTADQSPPIDYPSVVTGQTARQLPWVPIAAAVAIVILASVWLLVGNPYLKRRAAVKIERETSIKIVNETVAFTKANEQNGKHTELNQLSSIELNKLKELADLTQEMISAMKQPEFIKMQEAELAYRNAHKGASQSSLAVPSEFDIIHKKLEESLNLHGELKTFQIQNEKKDIKDVFGKLQDIDKRLAALEFGSQPHRTSLQNQLREIVAAENQRVVAKGASPLLALQEGSITPTQSRDWYEKELMASDKLAPALKEQLKPVHALLEDWKFVEEQKTDKVLTKLEERKAQRPNWPDWLKEQAQNKINFARTGEKPQPEKLVSPPAPATSKISSPPTAKPDSPRPVFYFFKENTDLSYPLPAGGEPVELMLRMAGQKEDKARPYGTGDSFGPDGFYFKKQGGNLISGTKPPDPPYRLAIKRGAAEIARIFVGQPPSKEDCLENTSIELTLKQEGKIVGTLPALAPPGEVSFKLKSSGAIDGTGKPYLFDVDAEGKCDLQPANRAIREQVKAKNALADKYTAQARKVEQDAKPPNSAESIGDSAVALANLWDPKKSEKPQPQLLDNLRAAGKSLAEASEEKQLNASGALYDLVENLREGLYKKKRNEYDKLGELKGKCFTLKTHLSELASATVKVKKLDTDASAAAEYATKLSSHPLLLNKLPQGDYTLCAKPLGLDLIELRTFKISQP